jgi:isocitrate dehydrogenase (NAD+)
MHRVTLIPGDSIGPETCEAAKAVLAAAGVKIDWDEQHFVNGRATEELLASCRESGTVLKARVAALREVGRLPATVQLRKDLGLWATVRPVRPLRRDAVFPETDLVVIRETSEDIYTGFEHEVTEGVYEAVKVTTRSACERIARYGFEYARQNGRKKLTIVHKSNIMKRSDGMFLAVARQVGEDYPDIETTDMIVDALCMRLVRNPYDFDVLLALNLFGDIVSSLCSGLAGGISASPSASYGDGIALFEALHGHVPGLVGKGVANPLPMINSSIMMLDHLGEAAAAERLRNAVAAACAAGCLTSDMGGGSSTGEVVDAIASRM